MYWFTADQHFWHRNIISLQNRPFDSMEHMIAKLVKNHNLLVQPSDTVFHVGDFSLGSGTRTLFVLGLLNGTNILLKGNHDRYQRASLPNYWQGILDGGVGVYLSHCPQGSWPGMHQGVWHLYGHLHGGLSRHPAPPFKSRFHYDVGVDNNNYMPVSLEQLELYFEV
jgi:calcineurin-like phosphoesterase family protein